MTTLTGTFGCNPKADADGSNLAPLAKFVARQQLQAFSCAKPENPQLFDNKHQNLDVGGSKKRTGSFSRKLQMLLRPTIGQSV